jgi:hypothetical protein
MSKRIDDHDLTEMVQAAASGSVNSRANLHGRPAWDDLPAGDKNAVRELALPFIFHGTKALHELGYRKPDQQRETALIECLYRAYKALGFDTDDTKSGVEMLAHTGIGGNNLDEFIQIMDRSFAAAREEPDAA